MPTKKQNIPIPTKGLERGKPGEFVNSRGTPDCQNVEISREEISKRIGESTLGITASERLLAHPELKVGTSYFLTRIGLTKFQEYASSTWTSRANAALTATAAETVDFTFPLLSAARVLVYTNGIDAIRKWTGSGNDASLGGTPPKAKYVLSFGGYLILANVTDSGTAYQSRVQWSDSGAIETWSGGNAGSTNLVDDEQDITGIELFGSGIVVHKRRSIYLGYLVTTSDVFRFDRKNAVGTVARGTIKNVPNGPQVYLSADGIRIFNGATSDLIPCDIQDDIREGLNPQYAYKSTAVIVAEKDEYWVALPIGSQTEPETVYKFNYRTGQVYKDTRTSLTCFGLYTNTSQRTIDDVSTSMDATPGSYDDVVNLSLNPIVLFGHSDGVTTKRQAVYFDVASTIESYWVSKDFTAEDFDGVDDPGALMRWMSLQIWAKGGFVDVDYSTDGGTTWVATGRQTLSSAYPPDNAPLWAYFDVVASKIRFKFKNSIDGTSFTLKQFQIEGIPREARR